MLDLTPLENAIARLEEGIATYTANPGDTLHRDGVIQRFEFTYEISHKMLKRYLEIESANSELIDRMRFPELIRTGNEQGLLLGDWPAWDRYRDARNETSHTYDEEVALMVLAQVGPFLAEAQFLLNELRNRA